MDIFVTISHKAPMNIPNALTIFRLIAALIIAWPFLLFDAQVAAWIAFIIFVAAAITDYLDGYLARKWNQTSALGKMLDPIADKVMVLIILCVINAVSGLNWAILLPTTLIFFREVLVSGMREYLGDKAKGLAVTQLAKWKTTMQMIAISAVLLSSALQSTALFNISIVLIWTAMILTIITGIDYAKKTLSILEE